MNDANQSDGTDADAALRDIGAKAVAEIMRDADADADLLEILTRCIVVPSPDANAVKQAAADIKKLAEERAEP